MSAISVILENMSTNQNTIDFYNNYAEKWAKHMRSGKNIAHEYLEKPAMYAQLPDLTDKKVLCLGCGTGEECEHLNSLNAKAVGIDISRGLIDYAKKSFPDIEFHVMNMEQVEFENESFDYVYSSLTMHYVDSWGKVLSEMHRVLKPDGTFLFSTHHPATWGAERTRTEDARTSLLGYKKDKKANTAEVVGDYLNTRKIKDVWFGDFDVMYYHRSLESIFKDITDSNFLLSKFLEPKSIESVKAVDVVFGKIHDKIPLFMIFKLKKPE